MSDVRMSPYELFGLPETYVLDETLLAERHLAAMQKVHPDRFADRSAAERRVAEQWSAVINEAFETLKSPVKRAVWLAKKRGAEVETEGQVRTLLEMGCTCGQGFYYDRPLPPAAFSQKYLRKSASPGGENPQDKEQCV